MSTISKQQLIAQIMLSGEQLGTESVAFHAAAAGKLGLDISSMKAIGLLKQHGSLTPSDIARHSGLTPGAVTALIDRLVAKNFVERIKDTTDRRITRIALTEASEARIDAVYAPVLQATTKLLLSMSKDELQTVQRYQERIALLMRNHAHAIVYQAELLAVSD